MGMRSSFALGAALAAAVVMSLGPPAGDLRAEETAETERSSPIVRTHDPNEDHRVAAIAKQEEDLADSVVRNTAMRVETDENLMISSTMLARPGLPRGDPVVATSSVLDNENAFSRTMLDGTPYLPRGHPAGDTLIEQVSFNMQHGRC